MRTVIAISLLGLLICSASASAQTAAEQAAILRDFHRSVADYSERHRGLDIAEAINAATPAPKIFTPPVAMVFRQLVAKALALPEAVPSIGAIRPMHLAEPMRPFPAGELADLPAALRSTLPELPASLEYRMAGSDLVIRDQRTNLVVDVLRDPLGKAIRTISIRY